MGQHLAGAAVGHVLLDDEEVPAAAQIAEQIVGERRRVDRQLREHPDRRSRGLGPGEQRRDDPPRQRSDDHQDRPVAGQEAAPGGVGRQHQLLWLLIAAEAQIGRRGRGRHPGDRRADVLREGGNVGGQVRQTAERAVILDRVVGCAHDAVGVPAAVPHQEHRQRVQADVVANLFERTRVEKWRDAVDPGAQARARQAGRDRDHVLLGDAGVDEPGAGRLPYRLERHEPEVAREKHEIGLRRVRDQRVREDGPHRPAISARACSYCAAVSGR